MASQNDKHPLRKLLIDELRDLYNAEKQLTRALPKLAKNASTTSSQRPPPR